MRVISLDFMFGEESDILHDSDFQLLLLANIMGPLGLALLSPVLDSLIKPFGTTATNIGLMMSAYTAPAIVMIPLAGLLSDKFGRKPLLVVGLFTVGAAGVAITLTTDFRIALLLRVFQGIGSSAIVPVIITAIGDRYNGAREATGQGFRFTSSGLIQVVFPLIAGFLVGIAWQLPFYTYAIAFPITVIIYLWLNEPEPKTSDCGQVETNTQTQGRLSVRDVLGYRKIQAVIVLRGLAGIVWISFLTYNSIIVVQFLGGAPFQAGILAAVASLSFAVSSSQAGRITAIIDNRIKILMAANIALGGGFVAAVFSPSFSIAVIGIGISGFGFGLSLSLYRTIITTMPPPSLRGTIVSIAEANGRATLTITPIAMGFYINSVAPMFGFKMAVQSASFLMALLATGGAIIGLIIMENAPKLPP